MALMQLGVDVGGTFTDAVLLADGLVHTAKAPTTPDDQSSGVIDAVRAVLENAGAEAGEVESFSHGMTVGTNALLERRGAPTALLATEGFTDLLEIARQDRPGLYRLCEDRPAPLADPDLRVGVRERIGPDGVVEPLSEAEIERVVETVGSLDCRAVAICLLFSYLDDSHEARLAATLRSAHPELAVSVSSEVLPRMREYERCSTTVIDAYLAPLLSRYLGRLSERASSEGLPEPYVMRSSGGVVALEVARRGAAWSVLSGPAGGAVGAAMLARLTGIDDALGFDMGGTSCDVCVVESGAVSRTAGRSLGGRPIQLPMVDVHTVGAGGGSIASCDSGGALQVGPRSAGSDPGPACYGRGGGEPTVTDANLLLGYLGERGRLAGGVELDREAAETAVGELADAIGLGPVETAEGILRLTNQEMVRALRVVTVERGIDPRTHALIAFGGAGAMHACAIAAELGIGRVLSPRAGGVLSALGLIAGARRHDVARTAQLAGDQLTTAAIATEVEGMRRQAAAGLGAEQALEVTYELRYRGQSFELEVSGHGPEPEPAALIEDFETAHERRYGYRDSEGEVELVGIRLAVSEPAARHDPSPASTEGVEHARRRARFGGEWVDTEVLIGEPASGSELEGPLVVELPQTTFVLPPGWSAEVDGRGSIDASAGAGGAR